VKRQAPGAARGAALRSSVGGRDRVEHQWAADRIAVIGEIHHEPGAARADQQPQRIAPPDQLSEAGVEAGLRTARQLGRRQPKARCLGQMPALMPA